jgi:NAD(P)H-hydrate epimerase
MQEINAIWISNKIHPRDLKGHKKTFGHVLVVAGSQGKAGAGILCARAVLRSGCGMVTVVMPKEAVSVLLLEQPELMYMTHDELVHNNLLSFDAIAIGPGLGFEKQSIDSLKHVLSNFKGPIIIDADAISYLSDHKELLQSNFILTPHPGEFSKLMGEAYEENKREQQAHSFVSRFSVTLVLKGAPTLVVDAHLNSFVNTTGNDGMATAGSGDVLTGIIAALCAQQYNNFDAACIGVFIHGLAGDMAIQKQSKASLVAGDIIESLKEIRLLD